MMDSPCHYELNYIWRCYVVVELDQPCGIVCLFCGSHTLLPILNEPREFAGESTAPQFSVALIRCRLCGKEAPYGSKDIVRFQNAA